MTHRKLLRPLVALAGVLTLGTVGLVAPAALAAGQTTASAVFKWSAPILAERPPYTTSSAIDALSCTKSECVGLDDWGGVLTSASPAGGAAAWHVTRASVPPADNSATGGPALSCAAGSPVLCAGVENGGLLVSTSPAGGAAAWQQLTVPISLDSMACPSASFCIGGGSGGFEFSADPAGGAADWHSVKVGKGAYQVSCASRSFCAAVDTTSGDLLTSTSPAGGRRAWKVTDVNGPVPLDAISCPAASLCVATDSVGDVLTSARPAAGASAWKRVRLSSTVNSITCASKSECTGVSMGVGLSAQEGELVTSTNPAGGASAWHLAGATWIPPQNTVFVVHIPLTCPSARLCVAGNPAGDIITSARPAGGVTTWQPVDVDGSNTINAMTCPSSTLCVAGDAAGNVLTSTDPAAGRWKLASVEAPQPQNDQGGGIRSITCPDTRLCVATDADGRVLTSTNPAGGAKAWHVQASIGIDRLVCLSARLCIGIAGTDVVASADPTGGSFAWGTDELLREHSFTTLSCPNPSLCVTTDDTGHVWTTTRPDILSSWKPTANPVASSAITGLSCAGRTVATTVCAITDSGDQVITSHDVTGGYLAWSAATLPGTQSLGVPYCPGVSLCLAVAGLVTRGSRQGSAVWYSTDPAGGVFTWKDKFTSPVPVSGSTYFGGITGPGFSCLTRTLCIGPWNTPAQAGVITTASPIGGGKSWTVTPISPPLPFGSITALSCASTRLCVAGDSSGNLYTGTR
jgi:hypothetical protein